MTVRSFLKDKKAQEHDEEIIDQFSRRSWHFDCGSQRYGGTPMKMSLRNHPFLTREGMTWPPKWVWTGGEKATAQGEVGILRDVKTHDEISSKCFVFIEHDSATFIGRLSCESQDLCQELVKFLKQHRGEPLILVGDMSIDLADDSLQSASRCAA
jgi:hypothetical protein